MTVPEFAFFFGDLITRSCPRKIVILMFRSTVNNGQEPYEQTLAVGGFNVPFFISRMRQNTMSSSQMHRFAPNRVLLLTMKGKIEKQDC